MFCTRNLITRFRVCVMCFLRTMCVRDIFKSIILYIYIYILIDNILYSTRKLVKSKKIFKTWVYKNKVYINIDDNNDNIYISDTSQLNNLV